MVGSFTDYTENKILDHITGKAAFSAVSPTYVCLMVSPVDDTSSGSSIVEPATVNGYWRVTTTPGMWNSASSGFSDNASLLSFPLATTPWGVVTYFGLTDTPTPGTGNLLGYADFTISKTVLAGSTMSFAVGDFELNLE